MIPLSWNEAVVECGSVAHPWNETFSELAILRTEHLHEDWRSLMVGLLEGSTKLNITFKHHSKSPSDRGICFFPNSKSNDCVNFARRDSKLQGSREACYELRV
jgi:hypothetical protein